MIKKFFFVENDKWLNFLLNEGMYAPSKFNLIANLILLDKNNLKPAFLQYFLSLIIVSKLCFEL
mgnify:CR=1 FL=1